MQDVPTAAELIEAVREFLEEDVHATAEGRTKFHARVAMNVLGIVQRELELGPASDEAEHARLLDLLPDADRGASLAELNAELAVRIREGAFGDSREALVTHLRETISDKLAIANPRYLGD
jgi:hypothetical protein